MGKVLRKIAGKVIVLVLKTDGINCTGSLQVCAGQETGIEAAAHSLNSLYNNKNTDAVLLVDASNAFNLLNRELFLHNISYISLAISVFVKSYYKSHSRLIIIGTLWYMVTITSTESKVGVLVYVDDFSAAGKFDDIRKWWDTLNIQIICRISLEMLKNATQTENVMY